MLRRRGNKRKKAADPARKPVIRMPKIVMPSINWRIPLHSAILAGVLVGTYTATTWALDKQISTVRIEGRFDRVSSAQVEAAIMPFRHRGFLSINLREVQAAVTELTWVERASVRRSWPATLVVVVTEERAAAQWREAGLLNVYGKLFVEQTSHIPAELPHLSGPPGTELEVAKRFFALDTEMQQRGLTAVSLQVDARGAWELGLGNGMIVRFGAVAVDSRIERFFDALDGVLAPIADQVEYIDMRYTNGFAIGWRPGSRAKFAAKGESGPHA
jgi:cell division protein FtsQ